MSQSFGDYVSRVLKPDAQYCLNPLENPDAVPSVKVVQISNMPPNPCTIEVTVSEYDGIYNPRGGIPPNLVPAISTRHSYLGWGDCFSGNGAIERGVDYGVLAIEFCASCSTMIPIFGGERVFPTPVVVGDGAHCCPM